MRLQQEFIKDRAQQMRRVQRDNRRNDGPSMILMGNFVRMSGNHATFEGCRRAKDESGRLIREGVPQA